MKKLFATVILLGVVGAGAVGAQAVQPPAEPQVDMDEVNRKIDAKLHLLLQAQLARHR